MGPPELTGRINGLVIYMLICAGSSGRRSGKAIG